MASHTTSSAWIQGIVDLFEGAGLDVPGILAEAGVERALLADPNNRAPTELVSRLWRVAAERSGNPAIGLIHPHVPKPGNFDIVAYAMLSSRCLRTAIQDFARHLRLVSDAASISLETQADAEIVRLNFRLFGGGEPMPRQRVEFDLLTMLTFCRWVSGRAIKPAGLFLVWPAPADAAPFDEAFQCPLFFDAAFNGIDFLQSDIDAPLPGYNPAVASLHDKLIEQRLAAMDDSPISGRARDEITRRLATGEPRREQVAQALNVSDRTLTRRLQEEGTSFQQLLDRTRCDLAQHYLSDPRMSLAEVAYLLGFSDQSAFFRACRRWFNVPPGQIRDRLGAASRR